MHSPGGHLQLGSSSARADLLWPGRLLLTVFLLLTVASAHAQSAVNVYLSLPGVPGNSTDAGHVGWTQVQSWTHGMAPAGSGSSAPGRLVLLKPVDQGSPALNADLCRATSLLVAQLDFVQTGATNLLFYQITLSNVLVSEMDLSADSAGLPSESVALTYQQIAWTYTVLDSADNPSRTNFATWDGAARKGSYSSGPVVLDSDGDGIPDSWMNQYFGHPTGQAADHSLANQDADGDGLSNYQEYIAGTNPTQANSVFRVSRLNLASGQVRVTWTSVAGKTYSLYGASTVNGPYSLIAGGIPSAGTGETSYDLPNLPTRQFFRVSVP